MILLVNSTASAATADTSDAAERQSDKAWGFEPQVAEALPVCALKGHREDGFFLRPFRAQKLITIPTWG
ncbi:MAG: hypothetical protein GY749_05235 [Desulfobacteraceae bacterium]|nr:hypothetical protein [Desulfobacteraceae bacterium]